MTQRYRGGQRNGRRRNPTQDDAILAECRRKHPEHESLQVVREHGGVYVTCPPCGFIASAHESNIGPVFDLIETGDETCLDRRKK